MKISSMTQEDLITLHCDVSSKDEAIDALLEVFKEKYNPHLDYTIVKEKIMDRETRSNTTFENGLAIPHTRIEDIDDVVYGILTPKTPFKDRETLVHMMIIILSSSSATPIYLKVLSSLTTLFSTSEQVIEYSQLTKTTEFMEKIKDNDIVLSIELKAKDIINGEFISLLPTDTVAKAIHLMGKNRLACLPVCDEENTYLGVVHFNDIISIGIPYYLQLFTSMRFVTQIDPMEKLFKNEETIMVKDIMNRYEITVNYEENLIHVLLLMIKKNKLFIPVLNGGKCSGVIEYSTLINNYLSV